MYGVSISLYAETASFRDPGGQLFHSCLPLPPVSTVIGIAGAALGKSFEETWNFFKKNHIGVGVQGKASGLGKDLWNFVKRTVYDETSQKNDIVNREFLYQLHVDLYYASNEVETIIEISRAFCDPVYALTLGNSDELAKIKNITEIVTVNQNESYDLKNTIIEGDFSVNISFDWASIKQSPINIKLNSPVVKKLPIDFSFSEDKVRKANMFKTFTFLSEFQTIKNPVKTFFFGSDKYITLIFLE
jgi:CRISPR-associated protein Cas5t